MADEQVTPPKKKKPLTWLLYMSILASGVLLLADALNYAALEKLTAKLAALSTFSCRRQRSQNWFHFHGDHLGSRDNNFLFLASIGNMEPCFN